MGSITSRRCGHRTTHGGAANRLTMQGRQAHHRCRACFRPTRALAEILAAVDEADLVGKLGPAAVLAWRRILDDARPYLEDETGDRWL